MSSKAICFFRPISRRRRGPSRPLTARTSTGGPSYGAPPDSAAPRPGSAPVPHRGPAGLYLSSMSPRAVGLTSGLPDRRTLVKLPSAPPVLLHHHESPDISFARSRSSPLFPTPALPCHPGRRGPPLTTPNFRLPRKAGRIEFWATWCPLSTMSPPSAAKAILSHFIHTSANQPTPKPCRKIIRIFLFDTWRSLQGIRRPTHLLRGGHQQGRQGGLHRRRRLAGHRSRTGALGLGAAIDDGWPAQ